MQPHGAAITVYDRAAGEKVAGSRFSGYADVWLQPTLCWPKQDIRCTQAAADLAFILYVHAHMVAMLSRGKADELPGLVLTGQCHAALPLQSCAGAV